MKKGLLLLLIVMSFQRCVYSQKANLFQYVAVPDSIVNKLEKAYTRAENANAGKNVFNLSNRKDFIFKDGIYSFQGQGPHFPRRIFIYNDSRIYIFENDGTSNPKEVIEEFLKSIPPLKLTNKQIVKYSSIIANYLEQEFGKTYGAEIK